MGKYKRYCRQAFQGHMECSDHNFEHYYEQYWRCKGCIYYDNNDKIDRFSTGVKNFLANLGKALTEPTEYKRYG
jgi:hypothetical protein